MGPTWRNGRIWDEGISKRLDQFLASDSLLSRFCRHRTWSHPSVISNQFLVCFKWEDISIKQNFPFKFNRAWLMEEDFSHVVGTSWLSESLHPPIDDMSLMVFKLKRLKVAVKN